MFEVYYQVWRHEDGYRVKEWTERFDKLPEAMRTALRWADDMSRNVPPMFEVSIWEMFEVSIWEIDDDGTLLSDRPLFDLNERDY